MIFQNLPALRLQREDTAELSFSTNDFATDAALSPGAKAKRPDAMQLRSSDPKSGGVWNLWYYAYNRWIIKS